MSNECFGDITIDKVGILKMDGIAYSHYLLLIAVRIDSNNSKKIRKNCI